MGLFDDTIRDARRPLAGAWVWRAAADDETEVDQPMVDEPADSEPSGMQTVFRFQKAGSPAMPGGSREASFQRGAEYNRLPAGDLLPAGAEDESPEPPAVNVTGNRGISVASDNRTSNLETGQEEHASPSKMAVANAGIESATTVQSVVSPDPVGTKPSRGQQPNIPEGSEQPVSRSGEPYQSGPTGRGAPSEFFFSLPPGTDWEQSSPSPIHSRPAATRPIEAWPRPEGVTGAPQAKGLDLPATTPEAPMPRRGTVFPAPAPDLRPTGAIGSPSRGGVHTPTPSPAGGGPEPAAPGLVIGRIDVVVVAGNTQAQPAARPQTDGSFLSRNYLKRL